jgi:hypothetical protein
VGPRDGVEAVAKRKIPCSSQESNHGRPSRTLVRIFSFSYLYRFLPPTAILYLILPGLID